MKQMVCGLNHHPVTLLVKSLLVSMAVASSLGFSQTAVSAQVDANPLAALHFRFLGPDGNRDISVVGVPGDPQIAYFGAAAGGIWKTTDGGAHFKPVFDSTDVSAVGALALAPSDPNIVWAGTGEPYLIRQAISPGDGVYKSTDAGETWRHMGLDLTGYITNIAINPANPNVVFVCALGQAYKPNPERGVYRTEDGGQTWKQVLKFDNDTTGCSGLSMDVHDPNTLFASTWQLLIRPWDLHSGGTDGGVYVTHDGGNTWSRLGAANGLPAKGTPIGKTAVRVAPSNGNVVYALMQSTTGLLYRSSDGGRHWTLVHKGDDVDLRAPYYTNFTVAPNNENLLFFPSTPLLASQDGGHTVTEVPASRGPVRPNVPKGTMVYPGGDTHDVWIDPKDPKRILAANDEGGAMTMDGGLSWLRVVLPIAQIYHVYTDNSIPYNVIGNRQDTGGEEGPSRVLAQGFGGQAGVIPSSAWHGFAGCESGFGVPDPVDPNIIWSGCYNGDLVRVDLSTGQSHNVSVWPVATFGAPTNEVRDRWNWSFPIAISPFNHNQVFTGSQYVYATTDSGQSWKRISPDLTTGKHLGSSGGLTVDNLMTFSSASLSMIDESPVKAGIIWAGSYDGQVSVTQDGGAHWANVTPNIKGLPAFGTINLQASPFNACGAIISSNLKEMGDFDPYIFQTEDCGKTWKSIAGDIPHSEFSYVHVVREDPVRKGMLYAGTENALYLSWDDGSHWTHLRNNFPPAPVYWLQIQPKFNDLVIATYGRGIWVLDDVTPLRAWDRVVQAGEPHLFAPREAYRFRTVVTQHQQSPNSVTVGENIPYGADLNYYLPAATPIELTIANSNGQVVRTLQEKGTAGLNRVFWNLRYPPLNTITLRVAPPGNHVAEPPPPQGRPAAIWGQPRPPTGSLVAPGTFTVTLRVNGNVIGSAPLQVLRDPHDLGAQADMEAQEQFMLQMDGEINQTVNLVNRFENVRKQIETLLQKLGTGGNTAQVRKAAETLDAKAIAIEGRLYAVHNAGETEDSFRMSPQLYAKLGSLYNNVSFEGASSQPTQQQIQANDEFKATLASAQQQATQFERIDLAHFNKLAGKLGGNSTIEW